MILQGIQCVDIWKSNGNLGKSMVFFGRADMEETRNKHNAELLRTDPSTKVAGEFSTRGHIFPPNDWNEFLL